MRPRFRIVTAVFGVWGDGWDPDQGYCKESEIGSHDGNSKESSLGVAKHGDRQRLTDPGEKALEKESVRTEKPSTLPVLTPPMSIDKAPLVTL